MKAGQRRLLVAVVAVAVVAALLRLGVLWTHALPDGPQPVAWDRATCARCRMLVGEPHFAAQLQTRDGAVLDFDDPGCLLLYLHEHDAAVHAIYLHHRAEERWLSREEAGFLPSGPSPMGYDLGVVERSHPGAVGWNEALEQSLAREGARPGRDRAR